MCIKFCIIILLVVSVVASENSCYWNAECAYQLFSTKTPYDAVRGDFRDQADPPNCQPISIWTINRHGNRNPSGNVTISMKTIASLKDQIIASYEAGRGKLCAQDIEDFRKWNWSESLETSTAYLTSVGYQELFNIGKRLREKYPQLLNGSAEEFYFRPTNEQRTIASAVAFVHGLSDGTNLSLVIDECRDGDDVIRTYEYCDKYQQLRQGPEVRDALAAFANTTEYRSVQNAVQQRLEITTQLSTDDIYALYDMCRFYRSWSLNKQSPWCVPFSNDDLKVLEFKDDVRHYFTNGYKSWINVRLGAPAVEDLYDNFEAAVHGRGKHIVSYFTHDTMMEMVFCALGMYKDSTPLAGYRIDPYRLWRTSVISALANNLIAVLYKCQESETQDYRVQIFHNEKLTELCPSTGCSWKMFREKLQPFTNSTLDFCKLDYPAPVDSPRP